MEVFGMVVFVGFIALLVRSLFKKPNGKKVENFLNKWEAAEPRNAGTVDELRSSPTHLNLPGNRFYSSDFDD